MRPASLQLLTGLAQQRGIAHADARRLDQVKPANAGDPAPPDESLVERWEFYDTVADPGELHPLTGDAELLGELQGRLAEWQRTMALLARRWETGPARLSPEEEARLRSLGYLP